MEDGVGRSRPFYSVFLLHVLIIKGLMLSSCAFVSSPDKGVKAKNFNVRFNQAGWSKTSADLADYAFIHNKTRSTIIINSLCQKYERTTLHQLTDNILAGLMEVKIEEQAEHRLFDRAALKTKANGILDGVNTYFLIDVVKKDRCIYDFILITKSADLRNQLTSDFEQLLKNSEVVSK